jgi:hypothetical protein
MPIPANQMINIEVAVHGTVAAGGSTSRLFISIFHFARQNPALALPTKAQIDTAFQAQLVVPIGAALNLRFLQSFNTIRYLDDVTDPVIQFSHAVVGAITGDSMSTINSAFQLARSGLRGKAFLGKKHLFPLSESDTTAGSDDIFNAAAITRFTAINTAWLAGFTDASSNVWVPTVFSKSTSIYKTNPTTINAPVITSILLNKRLGHMRHRRVNSDY